MAEKKETTLADVSLVLGRLEGKVDAHHVSYVEGRGFAKKRDERIETKFDTIDRTFDEFRLITLGLDQRKMEEADYGPVKKMNWCFINWKIFTAVSLSMVAVILAGIKTGVISFSGFVIK